MRVGVIGASGFIGSHLVRHLQRGGHSVSVIGRGAAALKRQYPDLEVRALPHEAQPIDAALTAGLDALVCAAGTVEPAQMAYVHEQLPAALARLAQAAGIGHFIHLSAIGAAPDAPTAFLRSKAMGEAAALEVRAPGWTVLRPSLVYGPGGDSMAVFAALAALPLRPRLGGGYVRPVAIDDLTGTIVRCLQSEQPLPPVIDVVGPDRVTCDGYIDAIGGWLGIAPLASLPLPDFALRGLATFGALLGLPLVRPDMIAMLRQGADGNPRQLPAALGLQPTALAEGLRAHPATDAERFAAKWWSVGLLLRLALSALWVGSGLASLWSYGYGLDLLAQGGIGGSAAHGVLVAGAAWDIALGLAMLVNWRLRLVAGLQALTIVVYTVLASIMLPLLWSDPLAPLLKNVPILIATLALACIGRK
jgi:uncharacterized protein YbjT (DUF2867 family)